jgi:ABC-type multidrug transport system ATPase subunit
MPAAATSPAPLWTLESVTLRGGARPRLADLSLEIFPGVTAGIGYSGAGKTSLLNLLVRFEPPTSGQIRFHGAVGNGLPLFWVPENDGLWPHLTVADHLRVVSQQAGRGHGVGRDLLQQFDLLDLEAARPDRLSRGERSRLSVARALAAQAAVLVMDEPLAHVDPARLGRYWDAVRTGCREAGSSLVFATHSPQTVLAEAERVVCLKDGQLCYTGSADALYRDPPSAELAAFLGAANWFEPDEAGRWLENAVPGRRCYRPEQLQVVPAATGRLIVAAARFCGAQEELELRQDSDSAWRRLVHRPADGALRPGDRVCIKAIEP